MENLERGMRLLESNKEIVILRRSRYYETSPVDLLDQPEFINNVVEIQTSLSPTQLLERTKLIEASLNTEKRSPKGPRILDIDILTYHDEAIDADTLMLPHPSMCDRRFVLIPLLEIAPESECVRHQRSYRECLVLISDPDQEIEVYHG